MKEIFNKLNIDNNLKNLLFTKYYNNNNQNKDLINKIDGINKNSYNNNINKINDNNDDINNKIVKYDNNINKENSNIDDNKKITFMNDNKKDNFNFTYNKDLINKENINKININYNQLEFDINTYNYIIDNLNNFNNKNFVLYKIPNNANILKYVYDIHKSDLHRGICSLRNLINNKFLYFEGSSLMAEYIVKTYSICLQKNKNTLVRQPSGQIITFYPLQRLVMDLTDLPEELSDTNNNLYLYNIIDHFSKNGIS